MPKRLPVRAKPVIISSAIRRAPFSRATSCTARKKSGGGTMLPAVPCIGSTSTAASLPVLSFFSLSRANSTHSKPHEGCCNLNGQRAQSAYGVSSAPGGSGPKPCLKSLPICASAPLVLPWKPPQNESTSNLPVWARARRSALSTASEPPEKSCTLSRSKGSISASSASAFTRASVVNEPTWIFASCAPNSAM